MLAGDSLWSPAMRQEDEQNLHLSYGHNTESMCIGFMRSDDAEAQTIMSRQEHVKNIGQPLVGTIALLALD